MIGLWEPNAVYGQENGIARNCPSLSPSPSINLLAAIKKLNECGIETLGFAGHQTHELTVHWVDALGADLFSRS